VRPSKLSVTPARSGDYVSNGGCGSGCDCSGSYGGMGPATTGTTYSSSSGARVSAFVGLAFCTVAVILLLVKQHADDVAQRSAEVHHVPPWAVVALLPGGIGFLCFVYLIGSFASSE
jgi:hypothetical protein